MRTCTDTCGTTAMSGPGSCIACEGTCATGCAYNCMGSCQGGCDGYCDNNAMGHATSCGGDCSSSCVNTCVNGCNTTCRGNAYESTCSNCVGRCEGSCAGTCIGEDQFTALDELVITGEGVTSNGNGTWRINNIKDLDIEFAVKTGEDTGDLVFLLDSSMISRDDGRSLKARIDEVDALNVIPVFASMVKKITINGAENVVDGEQNINFDIDLSTVPEIVTSTAQQSESAALSVTINGETKNVDAEKIINLGYLGGIALVDGAIPDIYFSDELKAALTKAKTNKFLYSITIDGNRISGVDGVIDLSSVIASYYQKPAGGIPLTDLSQELQDAIDVPDTSAETVTCNRITTGIDPDGAIPIGLRINIDAPIQSIKGNVIKEGIRQKPEASLDVKINDTVVPKDANNSFDISMTLLRENLIINGKPIDDVVNDMKLDKLLGVKVGDKTFMPDENHVLDLGVYDTAYDGIVESITGNVIDNTNPTTPTANVKITIGDVEITPDEDFILDVAQGIIDAFSTTSGKNIQETLLELYENGLKYLKVKGVLQEPNEDGFIVLTTPTNAYVRPAGGIPLSDLSPIFQNALTLPYANHITVGGTNVPIVDGIADFTEMYDGAYVKPSTGVPAADLDAATRQLLSDLKTTMIKSITYDGTPYYPTSGEIDLTEIVGGTFYQKPTGGIPVPDFEPEVAGKLADFDKVVMSIVIGEDLQTGTELLPDATGLVVIPMDNYYIMPAEGIPFRDLDPSLQTIINNALSHATGILFNGGLYTANSNMSTTLPSLDDPANIDTDYFTETDGEISMAFSDTQINNNLVLSNIDSTKVTFNDRNVWYWINYMNETLALNASTAPDEPTDG
jgi:hypothetical protein